MAELTPAQKREIELIRRENEEQRRERAKTDAALAAQRADQSRRRGLLRRRGH